ncbi:MAG: flagellin, partial [Pseudomonadota bacterium]
AYSFVAQDASVLTEAAQTSLGAIVDLNDALIPTLLISGNTTTNPGVSVSANDARSQFGSVVAALNTSLAGRALFGGIDVDRAPLAEAEDMLTALSAAVAAETTAAGVEAAVDAWFDTPGGGFETVGYQGSTNDLAPFTLGPNDTTSFAIRADNPVLRDVMKTYAMAALVDAGTLAGDLGEQATLLNTAGERMADANTALGALRGELGVVEGRVETALARSNAEIAALELAETELIEADPFQTATQLQAAEIRLETLFAITARLSRLSLLNYIQ